VLISLALAGCHRGKDEPAEDDKGDEISQGGNGEDELGGDEGGEDDPGEDDPAEDEPDPGGGSADGGDGSNGGGGGDGGGGGGGDVGGGDGGGIPRLDPRFDGSYTAPTDPGNPLPSPGKILPFTTAMNNLAVVPGDGKVYMADGFQNAINVFDTATLATVRRIDLPFPPGRIAFPPSTTLAYVGCTSAFGVDFGGAVVDTATDRVVASIDTGFCPSGIGTSSARAELYMSFGSENSARNTATLAIFTAPFDGQASEVTPTAVVPLRKRPGELIVAPDSNKVYVALTADGSSAVDDEIAVIDLVSRSQIATIALGVNAQPVAFALTADETRLYVANRDANEVAVIDTATNTVVDAIAFPQSGSGFAGDGPTALLLSDGDDALVVARAYRSFETDGVENLYANVEEGLLSTPRFGSLFLSCYRLVLVSDNSQIDTDGNTVSVVDTSSLTIQTSFAVGRSPIALVLADNAERYFTASRCEPAVDHVDVATLTLGRLTTTAPATAMAVSSDGAKVFVAHSDSLSVVDANLLTVGVANASGNGVRDLVYVDSIKMLYASRPGLNRVDAADLTALQTPIIRSIATGPRPGRLAVDDAGIVYALNLGSRRTPGRSITRITGTAVLDTIDTADAPTDIAFDGNRAFVTSFGDLIPVTTNQPELRRGFGDTIMVVTDLDAAPSSAELLVNDDNDGDPIVNGPLFVDYQDLGAGEAKRLVYSNYAEPYLVTGDPSDPTFFQTYRIPVGFLPLAQEVRAIDDAGTPRMLVFLLTRGDAFGSRLSVIDPIHHENNGGGDCDFPSEPYVGCIAFGLGRQATSMAVGAGIEGSVVITSFDEDQVAIYRTSEILPDIANANSAPTFVDVGDGPIAVLVRSDGDFAYVANELAGTVSIIDLASNTLSQTLAVGGAPISLGEDPATHRIFVGDRFDSKVTVVLDQAIESSFTLPN
jgi:YVTN family beta-propeller protein